MNNFQNLERSAARLAAVQALYQMETAATGIESVIQEFNTHRLAGNDGDEKISNADAEHFADIARGVIEAQSRIDRHIEQYLAKGWVLTRIDATARAILRAGVYELMRREDIPFRVVIDEYVDIANAFFDGEEPRFINAVLDAYAHEARDGKTDCEA